MRDLVILFLLSKEFVPRKGFTSDFPSNFRPIEGRIKWRVGLVSDISNNAGSCQDLFYEFFGLSFLFSGTLPPSLRRVVLFVPLKLCFDDHGSFVIFRSVSVRPRHLIDQNFDHDYFFKLPLQGAGCPITSAVCYFPPCRFSSCPAYEPNSNDGE